MFFGVGLHGGFMNSILLKLRKAGKRLLFITLFVGAQGLNCAKRVCAPQEGQLIEERINEARERARELQAPINAYREQQRIARNQAMDAARKMLEESIALRQEARRADLSTGQQADLRSRLQNFAQRLEDEANEGPLRIYSQQNAGSLQLAAGSLRTAADNLSHREREEERFQPRSFGSMLTLSRPAMPINDTIEISDATIRNLNFGSDSTDTE
jgi:hypothetical protein